MKKNQPEREAVFTTIVGGRPPGCGTSVGNVPRGIEVLVKKAAVDPDFKGRLHDLRSGAAAIIGLVLQPAEKTILDQIPRDQLEAIIAKTRIPKEHLNIFRGRAAALMLMTLGAVGSTALADGDAQTNPVVSEKDAATDDKEKLQQEIKELVEENQRLESEIKRLHRLTDTLGIRPDKKEAEFVLDRDAMARFRGRVMKVNSQWGFIVVDVSSTVKINLEDGAKGETKAPLKAGMVMEVFRGEKKIATVKISKLNDYNSVCDIVSQDEKIEIGDQVKILGANE